LILKQDNFKNEFAKPINTYYNQFKNTKTNNTNIQIMAYNARSIKNPFNNYSLHKILESNQSDIILITETWKNSNLIIQNTNYKAISNFDQGYQGVTLIYKKDLRVEKIFPELNDANILLTKIATKSDNLIIITLYINPNCKIGNQTLHKFIHILNFLKKRYASFSFLTYVDMNKDLRHNIPKPLKQSFQQHHIQVIYDNNPKSYTRSQFINNKLKSSYIDFFLISQLSCADFKLSNKIGNSDHKLLQIKITSTIPITIAPIKNIDYQIIRGKTKIVVDKIKCLASIHQPDLLYKFQAILDEQKRIFKPKTKKLKSFFKRIEDLEKKLLAGETNLEVLNNIINKHRSQGYAEFLDQILMSRLNADMKNLYLDLLKVFKMKPASPILESLLDPSEPTNTLKDKDMINSHETTNKPVF